MIPNHDGSPATETLPAAPDAIGAVKSASRTRMTIDPNHAGVAALITLVVAIAIAFALGSLVERYLGGGTVARIVLVAVIAPAALIARFLAYGGLGGPAITWVGEDGFAIARVRGGAPVVQTVRFADVGRMNLDKQPIGDARFPHVAVKLRVDDRRGKRLISIHDQVHGTVENLGSSTDLAAWERVEEVLRTAPTNSAAQLVRAITDAWTSRR